MRKQFCNLFLYLTLCVLLSSFVNASQFHPVGLRANLESAITDETEVILLLDGSHSILPENFEVERQVAEQILLSTSKHQNNLRFAIGLFSHTCQLSDFKDIDGALVEIHGLQQPRSNTNIADALGKSLELIKKSDQSTKKIVVLITDGLENVGESEPIARQLKRQGVELFCIGVSPQVSMDKLKRLATFGLAFYVDNFRELLSVFSAETSTQGSIADYEVTIQPALPKGLYIYRDFNIQLKVTNIGMKEIPAGSLIRFREGSHTAQSVIKVDRTIAPSESRTIEGTILVKGKPSIQDLDEVLEFDVFNTNGVKKIACKNNRIELSTEFFLGPFLEWRPFGGVSTMNILEFGIMGAGKSSFINTVETCLSSDIQDTVVVGGSLDHVTVSYEKVEFSPRVGIRFNIYDSWGVNDQNYEGTNMLNNFLDGKIPDGFPMARANDQQFVQEVIKNNSATAHERQIHAVLVFVKFDTDQNVQDYKMIQKYIGNCTAKGHNVLLVVTGVNKISNERYLTKLTEMSNTFGIPKSRIVLVDTYFEEMKKSFHKDKTALFILERILNIGNKYLEEHPETQRYSFVTEIVMAVVAVILSAVSLARSLLKPKAPVAAPTPVAPTSSPTPVETPSSEGSSENAEDQRKSKKVSKDNKDEKARIMAKYLQQNPTQGTASDDESNNNNNNSAPVAKMITKPDEKKPLDFESDMEIIEPEDSLEGSNNDNQGTESESDAATEEPAEVADQLQDSHVDGLEEESESEQTQPIDVSNISTGSDTLANNDDDSDIGSSNMSSDVNNSGINTDNDSWLYVNSDNNSVNTSNISEKKEV